MMIPENWKLIILREGSWKATACKNEGVREIRISTYDKPQETLEACLELLEQRIKE